MIGMYYQNGDRVRVDDAGKHHLGSVIADERCEAFGQPYGKFVWVKLDMGGNPVQCHPDELELND